MPLVPFSRTINTVTIKNISEWQILSQRTKKSWEDWQQETNCLKEYYLNKNVPRVSSLVYAGIQNQLHNIHIILLITINQRRQSNFKIKKLRHHIGKKQNIWFLTSEEVISRVWQKWRSERRERSWFLCQLGRHQEETSRQRKLWRIVY